MIDGEDVNALVLVCEPPAGTAFGRVPATDGESTTDIRENRKGAES